MAEIKTSDILNASEINKDLQDIIDKFNQLLAAMKQTSGEFQKSTNSTKKMTEADKKASEEKKQQIAAEKELIDAQKALQKQRQAGLAAMAKEEFKRRELIATATMEAKGLGELEAKLSAMKKIYRGMPQDTEKAKAAAERYSAAIRELDKVVKKGGEGLGEYQRYVGNYERGLMGLDMSFGQAGNSFADFDRDMGVYQSTAKESTNSTAGFTKGLAGMVAGVTIAIAAVKQIYSTVKESISAFLEADTITNKANKTFGDYADNVFKAAEEVQNSTTIEGDRYVQLATLASKYGAANSQVNQITKDAIALATRFEDAGLGEEEMLKALTKARNGDFAALNKAIPEFKKLETIQEKQALLNQMTAEGWKEQEDALNTYGGQIKQIQNIYGDMQEEVGGQLISGLFGKPEDGKKVTDGLNQIMSSLKDSQIIAKYFAQIREQAMVIIEPITKIFKLFDSGANAGDALSGVMSVFLKILDITTYAAKLFWGSIEAIVDAFLGLKKIISDVKNGTFEFQSVLNIVNDVLVDLLTPLTDIFGLTDDMKDFFGVAKRESESLVEMAKALTTVTAAGEKFNSVIEARKKKVEEDTEATEKAQQAYEDFANTIAKINQDYQIMIQFLKSDADLKNAATERDQKLFDASLSYYKKVTPEMKKLMDNYRIIVDDAERLQRVGGLQVANPNDIQLIKEAAAETENYYMKMFNLVNGFDFAATKPKTFFEEMIESAKKFSEFWAKNGEAIETTLSGISEGISGVYDNQINKQQLAADNNAKYFDDLLENYDQDSAEYQQLLAQKEAAQEQYQARLVELERKKAAFDKVKALIDIAINTAKGIISALASGNPILSAAIGVAGAVQAGVVASQPLPQYYVGLDSADKDHFGSVAERGAELVNYPDGTSELFTKPTITFIPKYTSIDTAAETAKKLAGAQFTADLTELNNSSRESIKYLGIIARNTQTRQSATDIHYINKYLK